MITLEKAKVLLGEIAYHGTIERTDNGFKFITIPDFTRFCKEAYITDEQIQNCINRYGNVANEGTQVQARIWVTQNL